MNILIICYCYPPDIGPRASRWSALAEFWAAHGHYVHVISARKFGATSAEIQNGVAVHRVGGAVVENLRFWLERGIKNPVKNPNMVSGNSCPGNTRRASLVKLLKMVYDVTWKKLYWPDSSCLWFFPARAKALKLVRDIPFDTMISTSTPYTGHLVGKAVKKAHPDLFWTVDIGDPFSFGQPPWNNTGLFEKLNKRSEVAVLELADSISVTVHSCKTAYINMLPGILEKITVIPPLFSGTAKARPAVSGQRHKGHQLVFTGSLYRDIRNPAYLLSMLSGVFERMPEAEAHFYGHLNDCTDLFKSALERFPKNLFLHGLVSREVATDVLQQADVLINIANRTRHQLPSKLVDYMASGKPILNIVSVEDDNSLSFLRAYPETACFIEAHDENITADVEKMCHFIANSQTVPQETISSLLHPFELPAIEAQYRKISTGSKNKVPD